MLLGNKAESAVLSLTVILLSSKLPELESVAFVLARNICIKMDRRKALALALIEGERLFPNSTLDTGKQRSKWVHESLRKRRHGEDHQLVQELRLDDGRFKAYFRMSRGQFDNLPSIVGTSITKMTTSYRESITVGYVCFNVNAIFWV